LAEAVATIVLVTQAMLGLVTAQPSTRVTEPSTVAGSERAAEGTVVVSTDFACALCGWFVARGAGR
jgi:hypothetical protein